MNKTRIISIAICISMIMGNIALADKLEDGTRSLLAIDMVSGDIAYSYNSEGVVEIASISKLMTYLVVMDKVSEGEFSLEDTIVVDDEIASIGGSSYDLSEGDIVSVDELLDALLIVSGNDACTALAKYSSGDKKTFVEEMNKKASELGLDSAVYYTPSGLPDQYDRENQMTTDDIYLLSRHIIEKYPQVLRRTSKEELIDRERDYREENTNPLIGKIDEVDGLKTGYTNRAGRCLVATAEKDYGRIVTIVMGTSSEEKREEKSSELMNHILDDFERRTVYGAYETIESVQIGDSKYRTIDVAPVEDIEVFVSSSDSIESDIDIEEDLELPIESGDIVGSIKLEYGLNEKEIDLTVSEDIGRFDMFITYIGNFLDSIFN